MINRRNAPVRDHGGLTALPGTDGRASRSIRGRAPAKPVRLTFVKRPGLSRHRVDLPPLFIGV
jgi:hypothetical protein